MRRLVRIFLFLVAAGVAWAGTNDWLIVPGQRVGPITANTSRADLAKLFGATNLKDDKIYMVEGQSAPGTWVYPNDAKKRLAVVWKNSAKTKVEMVKLHGSVSDWRTNDGITLGTRLTKLEQMNGKPFSFSGFDWDYGGNVVDWNGGGLDKPPYYLPLKLTNDTARKDKLTETERESMMGDRTLWSNAAPVQKLDPWVCEMVVTFPR